MSVIADKLEAVLFDLDGTFADTAPDLAQALNSVLQNHDREPLPFSAIRPVVSHGGRALIETGFNLEYTDPAFEPLRLELLEIYKNNIAEHTTLFPGIADILIYIQQQHLAWGIVTNKPGWLTEPLLEKLALPAKPGCIVSGDTLPQRKPDPEPLLYACQLLDCKPENTLYIGDAERDIIAGKRAQMLTCTALFGYIGAQDKPETWGADLNAQTTTDILSWLKHHDH